MSAKSVQLEVYYELYIFTVAFTS